MTALSKKSQYFGHITLMRVKVALKERIEIKKKQLYIQIRQS